MRVCCIIKPCALTQSDEIIGAIRDKGILVITQKEITYTDSLVYSLYDHMDDSARSAIAQRLSGEKGLALLLEVASVEGLLQVVGRESNPARCHPDSLRARFAKDASEERMGDAPWWENAIHRPVNTREAYRDLTLIFPHD